MFFSLNFEVTFEGDNLDELSRAASPSLQFRDSGFNPYKQLSGLRRQKSRRPAESGVRIQQSEPELRRGNEEPETGNLAAPFGLNCLHLCLHELAELFKLRLERFCRDKHGVTRLQKRIQLLSFVPEF